MSKQSPFLLLIPSAQKREREREREEHNSIPCEVYFFPLGERDGGRDREKRRREENVGVRSGRLHRAYDEISNLGWLRKPKP